MIKRRGGVGHSCNVAVIIMKLSNESLSLMSNSISTYVHQSMTELESHADTFNIGRNDLVTHVHENNGVPKYINVHGYDPILGSVRGTNIVNTYLAYP